MSNLRSLQNLSTMNKKTLDLHKNQCFRCRLSLNKTQAKNTVLMAFWDAHGTKPDQWHRECVIYNASPGFISMSGECILFP